MIIVFSILMITTDSRRLFKSYTPALKNFRDEFYVIGNVQDVSYINLYV